MARLVRVVALSCAAVFVPSTCTIDPSAPTAAAAELRRVGHVDRLDPALDDLVRADATYELIAAGVDGETWFEGPVWVPALDAVVYSEIPSNTLYRWRAGTEPTVWLRPSGYTGSTPRGGEKGSNGLALDARGHLLLCQHGDRRVARLTAPWHAPAASYETLADRHAGKRLNSPNDLAVRANGDVYFTDPPYGLEGGVDDPTKEIDVQGVYRIAAADGSVTLLTDDLSRPNGIAFSPDQRTLYVANSANDPAVIMAYDVGADGALANGRVFFESSGDGMAVDTNGNVYATAPNNRVLILAPDGTHLGSLVSPSRTSNCTFGDDGHTLYVTGVDVLRIRLEAKGLGF